MLGLTIGSTFLFAVAYLNLNQTRKDRAVGWIQARIFNNSFDSNGRAEGLFGVVTSLLLMAGGLMLIASIFILTNVELKIVG